MTTQHWSRVLDATRNAQEKWSECSPVHRLNVLERLSNLLEMNQTKIASVESLQSGTPIQFVLKRLEECVRFLRKPLNESELASLSEGNPIPVIVGVGSDSIRDDFMGVLEHIRKAQPVIWYPSQSTPLAALYIAFLFAEELGQNDVELPLVTSVALGNNVPEILGATSTPLRIRMYTSDEQESQRIVRKITYINQHVVESLSQTNGKYQLHFDTAHEFVQYYTSLTVLQQYEYLWEKNSPSHKQKNIYIPRHETKAILASFLKLMTQQQMGHALDNITTIGPLSNPNTFVAFKDAIRKSTRVAPRKFNLALGGFQLPFPKGTHIISPVLVANSAITYDDHDVMNKIGAITLTRV